MTTIQTHILGEPRLTYWRRDPERAIEHRASELIDEWDLKACDCRAKLEVFAAEDRRYSMTSISCDAAIDTSELLGIQYARIAALQFASRIEREQKCRRQSSRLFRFVSWLTGIPL